MTDTQSTSANESQAEKGGVRRKAGPAKPRRARDLRRPDPRSERTRTQLLDSAEVLFGDLGYDGVSMRQITALAGANVAAVRYHFLNKKRLYETVLERRLAPLTEAWAIRMRACVGMTGEACIDCMLQSFLEPLVDHVRSDEGPVIGRLIKRATNESNPEIRAVVHAHFDKVWTVFDRFYLEAMPQLDQKSALWKLHFLIIDILYICETRPWLKTRSGGVCDPDDMDETIEQLMSYIKFGMLGAKAARV